MYVHAVIVVEDQLKDVQRQLVIAQTHIARLTANMTADGGAVHD
jgi:hypothetical protein